jgi:hypothetical protein
MDRQKAKQIRDQLTALFKDADLGGLTAKVGNSTYDPDAGTVVFKVEISEPGALGKHEVAFNKNCYFYDLKKEDLHKVVTIRGEELEIVGLRPRARKMPVILKRKSDGKEYVFTISSVLFALGRKMSDGNLGAY